MRTVLVTGATGTLGRDLVPALRAGGVDPLLLSRRPDPDPARRTADLLTGSGLRDALAGVGTVLHLAAGRDQPRAARVLLDAAAAEGVDHLVFVSIVGVDRIPLSYYRAKRAAEQVVEDGPVPWTTLRAAQFHQLVVGMFAAQRLSPVLLVPDIPLQPIDTRAVADRLVELATAAPAGRVDDLAGPEVRGLPALARAYRGTPGPGDPSRRSRPRAGLRRLPGGAPAREGLTGRRRTFEEFLVDTVPAPDDGPSARSRGSRRRDRHERDRR
jgi:uncharacterized protein YbjT (DUF2867 family)